MSQVRGNILFIYILLLFCLSAQSRAATIDAASCSQTDVQSAINSAQAGDTVVLPSCSVTYKTTSSGTPSVTVNKPITVQGQTICSGRSSTLSCTDNTFIYDGTTTGDGEIPISMTANGARLTGITFLDTRSVTDYKFPLQASGTEWRVDHNHFHPTNSSYPSHGFYGLGTGLVDHNYFQDTNGGADTDGSNFGGKDGTYPGDYSWSQPLTLGTANAIYIEDNEFFQSPGNPLDGATDNYAGSRYVFRFNDVQNTTWGSHGLDSGGLRSTLSGEIYYNTVSNTGSALYTMWNSRGGTHMVFDNTVSSSGGSYNSFMWLQNYRSDSGYSSPWGPCDGTNVIDQNTSGQQGYGCRDQIGRGPETNPANDWPVKTSSPSYSESFTPSYSWGNLYKGKAPTISNVTICGGAGNCTRAQIHIVNNRDFYMEVPSFDGTAGTGTGPFASRPAKCTVGVAYWATDQGNWNMSGIGGQGQLYTCTATNTWTNYYTPYQYPHPLQGQGPPPPQGLGAQIH